MKYLLLGAVVLVIGITGIFLKGYGYDPEENE